MSRQFTEEGLAVPKRWHGIPGFSCERCGIRVDPNEGVTQDGRLYCRKHAFRHSPSEWEAIMAAEADEYDAAGGVTFGGHSGP